MSESVPLPSAVVEAAADKLAKLTGYQLSAAVYDAAVREMFAAAAAAPEFLTALLGEAGYQSAPAMDYGVRVKPDAEVRLLGHGNPSFDMEKFHRWYGPEAQVMTRDVHFAKSPWVVVDQSPEKASE